MKNGMIKMKKPCNLLITRFLFFLKVTQLGFDPIISYMLMSK